MKQLSDASPTPSLKEVLAFFHERLQAKLPILVDTESFKNDYPDVPEIYDTRVQFPPFPESMTVARALRHALDKVATKNATYVVLPTHVLITTFVQTDAERKLHEKVRGTFKGQFGAVVKELSETLGTTIVIDNCAGEKTKTEIAATFHTETPLGSVLRVFTEMADLKA